jgi:hypothetical protein
MAICRDCFNKLSYTLTNNNKDVFSVTKHAGPEPYTITKHLPYMRTDARITYYDGAPISWEIPPFKSFIHAVQFLKENANNLR